MRPPLLISWISLSLSPALIMSQDWPTHEYNYGDYSPASTPASNPSTEHPAIAQQAGASGEVIAGHIACGENASFSFSPGDDAKFVQFVLPEKSKVKFSNCATAFDTKLKVWNDLSEDVSEPYCANGDDCGDCEGNSEEFEIADMAANTYVLEIAPFQNDEEGEYVIDVQCVIAKYITLTFGPKAVLETITDNEWMIFEVLQKISKIDATNWFTDFVSPIAMDPNMNDFIEARFGCSLGPNKEWQDKLRSLVAMIEFDKGEMFMLLFNTIMEEEKGRDDIYITDMDDNPFMDIRSQPDVLHQYNPARDEGAVVGQSTVLGYGMLYSLNNEDVSLFCNDTWGWAETFVACRTMGYDYGIYLDGAYETITTDMSITDMKYANVQCTGMETSIWDCSMDTYPSGATVPNCPSWQHGVSMYCSRFVGVEGRIGRALKRHDSYDDFMPIVWGPYHEQFTPNYEIRNTMAPICYNFASYPTDLSAIICENFRNDGTSSMTSYTSSDNYWWSTPSMAEYDGFAQIDSYESSSLSQMTAGWIDLTIADDSTCSSNTKALYVTCGSDHGCVEPYGECATDMDCCQTNEKKLFCHPSWGNCVAVRDEQKPDGYSPCYSQSECKSGNCFSPGIWGRCSSEDGGGGIAGEDTCDRDDRCFRDDQCCEGYVCSDGSCRQDEWNGQPPSFWSIDGDIEARMNSPEQNFQIEGSGFRDSMLFKLIVDGACSADRSPVSNVPANSYAQMSYSWDNKIDVYLSIYSTVFYGSLELCYAVNDYANYESTGLFIKVGRLLSDNQAELLLSASVTWSPGFSDELHEDSADGYTEYELALSRPLLGGEYINLDMFWDEWSNLMFPRTSWFYHQDKSVSESMRFIYDEGVSNVMPGYRDSSSWNIPIKVRLEWDDNGYPEITDREFYVIHSVSGELGEGSARVWINRFRVADIEFTMIDDDPHITDSSLRREGEGTADGVAHIDGYRTGYEGLVFTCIGCGSDEMTNGLKVNYGEAANKGFYVGQDMYISTTMDYMTYEITASYVNFYTEYIPYEGAPTDNLMFEISVASRFDSAVSVTLSPDFSFSYPGNIDTTIPVIDRIKGDGCDNEVEGHKEKALNCPTDGKVNGTKAKMVLYGTLFPDTIENTTVKITIDGKNCPNVQWWVVEDDNGLRNASCEYPSGASAHGTLGYSMVELSYERNTLADGFEFKNSDPVKYFNYAPPAITEVLGCPNTESALHTANCTRTGEQLIRIIGSNFGPSGARVFIGGGEAECPGGDCHDADSPHSLLVVEYGPGTRASEKLLVMNAYGGTSDTEAFISYEQCMLGWRQKRTDEVPTDEHSLATDPNQLFRCVECGSGSYSNTLNSEICFECDAGKYQSLPGQTSCDSCPIGTYAPLGEHGNNNCTDCPPGEFASATGSAACTECPAGEFAGSTGSAECTDCPPGEFADTAGSPACTDCPPGEFSGAAGSAACTPCFARQFTSLPKTSRCGTCGDFSDANLFGDECLCDEGYYMYDTEEAEGNDALQRPLCQQCSEGMVCEELGINYTQIVPEAGYMPMIHTTPQTLAMMSCINEACVGDKYQNGNFCSTGYTGILCTDCEPGLGKAGAHACETCLDPAVNALRLVGVFIIAFGMIILFIRMTIKAAEAVKSDLSTIGKIFFSFIQFNSLALQFDFEFPPMVSGFLVMQEAPARVADGMISIDCFVKDSDNTSLSSVYIKGILYLVMPLVVLILCRVVWCKLYCMKDTDFDKQCNLRRRNSSLNELTRMELPEDSKAKAYITGWNHYITAVIMSIFMIHPNITQMTASLMHCKQLGVNDDDYYLIADMTAKCYDSTHWIIVFAVALPMGVLCVFGMPLFVLHRLRLNADELTKPIDKISKNLLNRYHFLIKGYEPEFYYWEIIIMLRKILMVCIAVWLNYDVQLQALCATLLVVVALCVHSLACPYVTDAMDGLELMSLFGSFCTYFFGQFLFTPAVGQVGRTFVSLIIVLVNLAFIVTVICMVLGTGLSKVALCSRLFRRCCCCFGKKKEETDGRANLDSAHTDTELMGRRNVKSSEFKPGQWEQHQQIMQQQQQQVEMVQQHPVIEEQRQQQQMAHPQLQQAQMQVRADANGSPMFVIPVQPMQQRQQQNIVPQPVYPDEQYTYVSAPGRSPQ